MTDIYREQSREVGTLGRVVIKQETVIANKDIIIYELKFQLKSQKKKNRKTILGAGGTIVLVAIVTFLIIK